MVTGLLLSDPESGAMTIEIETAFPGFEGAAPVRFASRGVEGVVFLSFRGSGADVATGLLDPQGRVGLDFSGVFHGLTFSGLTFLKAEGRKMRIAGRIPRGKEIAVFSCRRIEAAFPAPREPVLDSGSVSHLAGWSLPGGKDLVRETLKLPPMACFGRLLEIGDGWQGKSGGTAFGGLNRKWPLGSGKDDVERWLAIARDLSSLKEADFSPALWLVPHGQGEEKVFRERPEAFVRDKAGAAVHGGFLGRYVVDATSRSGVDYLKELFRGLRENGALIFRLGGLKDALTFYLRERRNLSDSSRDPALALGASILAMREGAGEGSFFAGDWGTPLELSGSLDSARPGRPEGLGRVDPLLEEVMATTAAYWLHRRSWLSECFPWTAWSEGRSDEERKELDRSRVLFAALTGRGILHDGSVKSPAWAEELFRPAWPPFPIVPIDFFRMQAVPAVWDLKLPQGGDLVGLFNLESLSSASLAIVPRELGLGTAPSGRFLGFDVVEERFVGLVRSRLDVLLLPGRSRLVALHAEKEHPQVVAVSGHYLATAVQLDGVVWDPARSELRGALTFPREMQSAKEARVHVALRPGDGVLNATAEPGIVQFSTVRGHLILRVSASGGDRVSFLVRFTQAGPLRAVASLEPPTDLRIGFDEGERRPILSWRMGEGLDGWRDVERFIVWRNGKELGRTTGSVFMDSEVLPGGSCSYAVSTLPGGQRTAPMAFSFPTARDAYLDAWSIATPGRDVEALFRRRSATNGPLSVGGRKLSRGLGTRSPSRVDYRIDGLYLSFEALVGVDDASRFEGSVVFVVLVDGEERYRSPVVRGGSNGPMPLSVPIRGGKTLSLLVEGAGDGSNDDLADWGEARVVAE